MISRPLRFNVHQRTRRRVRIDYGQLLTHVVLLSFGFLYVFPFLWMLASSLKSNAEYFNQGLSLIPGSWQWSNYVKAWSIGRFSTYFLNSVMVTLSVVVLVNLFTSMAGYALAKLPIPGKKAFLIGIAILMFLPKGNLILPTLEIMRALRLTNTLWAIIILQTAGGMLGNTFLFMGFFRTVHREIEEAAIMDGATTSQMYWKIMLPLARPMIATVTLLTAIGSWNDFFTPLVMTFNRPELRTLAVAMFYFQQTETRDWVALCAAATISLLPIILVFVFLQRFFIEGMSGAIKS